MREKNAEKPVRFDFRIPPKLHKKLVVIAEIERRSIHAQILLFVERGVERFEAGKQDG